MCGTALNSESRASGCRSIFSCAVIEVALEDVCVTRAFRVAQSTTVIAIGQRLNLICIFALKTRPENRKRWAKV